MKTEIKNPFEGLQKSAITTQPAMTLIKPFILLVSFWWITGSVNAQIPWEYTVKPGTWDYPVKPGTEQWKQFRSNEEMADACRIPENVLSALSTDDLTELCLRYPLFTDFLAFENPKAGLDKLFRNFNGLRELYQRPDVAKSLTKRYTEKIQSLSFLDGDNPDLEKGFFVLYVSIYEILLSRIEWKNSDEKEESKEVLQSLVAGFEGKMKYPDCFRGLFQTNFYARAHVLSKMDKTFVDRLPQKDENIVLQTGMVTDEQTFHLINELSYSLIKP